MTAQHETQLIPKCRFCEATHVRVRDLSKEDRTAPGYIHSESGITGGGQSSGPRMDERSSRKLHYVHNCLLFSSQTGVSKFRKSLL
jgi:hypothetical protein